MTVLSDPNAQRVYLVTLRPYDVAAGAERVVYAANRAYVTEPGDTPANTIFKPLVDSPIVFRRAAFQGTALGGRSFPQYGAVELRNTGELDALLDLDWSGRPVTIDIVGKDRPHGEAVRVFDGVADFPNYTRNGFSIPLRDRQHTLDRPVQENLYPVVDEGDQGAIQASGRPIPIALGLVRNVPARLIDSSARKYQVHDGAAVTGAVYENGKAVGYTSNDAEGTVTLTTAAQGFITADVGNPAGGLNVANLARELVTVYGPLTDPDDLDVAAFDALAAAAPAPCGLYLNEPANLLDTLDRVFQSIAGYYGFRRDGKLTVGQIVAPETVGTAVATFGENEILSLSMARLGGIRPRWRHRLDYQRNYTVQTQLDGIGPNRQAFLAEEYRTVVSESAQIKADYADPDDPDPTPTLIDGKNNAQAEADRQRVVFHNRDLFRFRLMTQGFAREIGDVVDLVHPRFNLAGGRRCQVIGIAEDGRANQTELTVFG